MRTSDKQRLSVVVLAASLLSATTALASDIVIAGGRVIDPETGLDAIRNVAIDDGKIVAITELPLQGDVVVEATGHVVAPGFIDLHAHGLNIGETRIQRMIATKHYQDKASEGDGL